MVERYICACPGRYFFFPLLGVKAIHTANDDRAARVAQGAACTTRCDARDAPCDCCHLTEKLQVAEREVRRVSLPLSPSLFLGPSYFYCYHYSVSPPIPLLPSFCPVSLTPLPSFYFSYLASIAPPRLAHILPLYFLTHLILFLFLLHSIPLPSFFLDILPCPPPSLPRLHALLRSRTAYLDHALPRPSPSPAHTSLTSLLIPSPILFILLLLFRISPFPHLTHSIPRSPTPSPTPPFPPSLSHLITPHSLTHSLTIPLPAAPSLTHLLPTSPTLLPRSLAHPAPRSVPASFPNSLTPSVFCFYAYLSTPVPPPLIPLPSLHLAPHLTYSLPHPLPPCLTHPLPHFLRPLSLPRPSPAFLFRFLFLLHRRALLE
ncbi:hypothetical protein B0H12DRAFT_303586 [Mycena haematopus]|nr:hypothetical protein B0H12DRAFT_303586 [Mycena haematopus]